MVRKKQSLRTISASAWEADALHTIGWLERCPVTPAPHSSSLAPAILLQRLQRVWLSGAGTETNNDRNYFPPASSADWIRFDTDTFDSVRAFR
jgi:hypothetical protein